MKIYYWNIHPNYGDLINPWLWPKIFPEINFGECPKNEEGITDCGDELLLVGIGTLINERFPISKLRLVLGSGVGYGNPPDLANKTRIYCVRGPLSAKKIGLPKAQGIIDPGVLINKFFTKSTSPANAISFMPQISSMVRTPGVWEKASSELGYQFISPTDDVTTTTERICNTGVLLTESMHGAIIAESLRVPWIPIITRKEILPFKWEDWCASIEIEYKPIYTAELGNSDQDSFSEKLKTKINYKRIIKQLNQAATSKPMLGRPSVLEDRIDQLETVFENFRNDFKNGFR